MSDDFIVTASVLLDETMAALGHRDDVIISFEADPRADPRRSAREPRITDCQEENEKMSPEKGEKSSHKYR